ncbi:MAG: acetylxylan esterase [Bryobacterales bacterium]|nr:acetylxylan esterase [Bryobacterales bacterium]
MATRARAAAVGAHSRRLLYNLLGDLPPRNRKISARTLSREERPGYVLEKLELDLNGFEPVPAWFACPKQVHGRIPAVLYNHAHGGDYKLGKDELLRGRVQLQSPPYAEALTAQGCCVLCMDTWVFGERASRTELDVFKEMLWKGQVLWGMMVYDSLRGIDYLVSRLEVDASRIATLGLSMGSTMAWWVAALDQRVKVTVDICCLTDFQALMEAGNLKGHGVYYYVPSLLKHFTTAQINALIAPRAHLSLAGNLDALTPPAGLDRIDRELKKVYAAAGRPDNWKLLRYDAGHQETAEGRREILAFLKQKL